MGTFRITVEIADPLGQRFEAVEMLGGYRGHVHQDASGPAGTAGRPGREILCRRARRREPRGTDETIAKVFKEEHSVDEKPIRLSNLDNSVDLVGAQIISITSTGSAERGKGEATIRFLLKGDSAMKEEPFNSVVAWQYEEAMVTLEAPELESIEGCSVRECNLDVENQALYIQLYVPFPAQQVRHWFIK